MAGRYCLRSRKTTKEHDSVVVVVVIIDSTITCSLGKTRRGEMHVGGHSCRRVNNKQAEMRREETRDHGRRHWRDFFVLFFSLSFFVTRELTANDSLFECLLLLLFLFLSLKEKFLSDSLLPPPPSAGASLDGHHELHIHIAHDLYSLHDPRSVSTTTLIGSAFFQREET